MAGAPVWDVFPFLYFFEFAMVLGIIPLLGGALIWQAFKIAGISTFTFRRCWKVYLVGCCYACLLILGVNFLLAGEPGFHGLRLIIFCVVPPLVVSLLFQNFSRKALLAMGIAILLVDLVVIALALFLSISASVSSPETSPGRRSASGGGPVLADVSETRRQPNLPGRAPGEGV